MNDFNNQMRPLLRLIGVNLSSFTSSQKLITSCSANSLPALSSNLTMINSDTLIEHMQGQPASALLCGYIVSPIESTLGGGGSELRWGRLHSTITTDYNVCCVFILIVILQPGCTAPKHRELKKRGPCYHSV